MPPYKSKWWWKGTVGKLGVHHPSFGFARSISCFCCLFSTKSFHSGLDTCAQNLLSQGHGPESSEKSKINDPDPEPHWSFTDAKLARQWRTEGKWETASDADSAFGDDFKYRLSHVRSDWYIGTHKELCKEHQEICWCRCRICNFLRAQNALICSRPPSVCESEFRGWCSLNFKDIPWSACLNALRLHNC